MTKSTIFFEKNLELLGNVFFIRNKKIIKHFVGKSFSVFGGLACETSLHTKYFWQNILFFFKIPLKNTISIISSFFFKFVDLIKICVIFFLHVMHFKLIVTKYVFLM